MYPFGNPVFTGIIADKVFKIHHFVGDHLGTGAVHIQHQLVHLRLLQCVGDLLGDHVTLGHNQLPGFGVCDRLAGNKADDTVFQLQLFIKFITADLGKVIALRIKKQVLNQGLRTLYRRRFTGAQLAVHFQQALLLR